MHVSDGLGDAFGGASFDDIITRRQNMTPEERAAEDLQRRWRLAEQTRKAAEFARLEYFARLREQFGARFAQRRFESWEKSPSTAAALREALEIAADPRNRGGWFIGEVNQGKTHLAAAIGHRAIDAEIPTIFSTGIRLLERVRETYDRDGSLVAGKRDVIGMYVDVDVLILDDLGKERWTSWVAERIYDLVNRRYEADRRLIVTSNLDPTRLARLWTQAGMDDYYGRSIVRRIVEMCSGKIIPIVERP